MAGNTSGYVGADLELYEGALAYGGSNLVQSIYQFGSLVSGPAPLSGAPDLASLGNYGGPTQTMPPLPGSPAIGTGSVAANNFTTDQRGYARTQNGLIDLGAVELPTVHFTASPSNGLPPLTVQFESSTVDSDGRTIVGGWNWNFGDGTASAGPNPTNHIYTTAGVFSLGLIVTNSLGLALTVTGPAINVNTLVTNTADNGPGTLRSAIENDAGENIVFAANLSGATITLAGTLAINTNLMIDASALSGGIQINGNGAVTVFNVESNTTVTLNSLTITNGFSGNGANGGGINNDGNLTVTQCTLSGNNASYGGGGIVNSGGLTLNQCTLSGNVAALEGGGVYNVGTATLNRCALLGNVGYDGGGIYNLGTAALNLCTLSGNSAGNNGSGGVGGGILNDGTPGSLTLNQCTLSGNSGLYGGGIFDQSTLAVTNTIVAGNNGSFGVDIFINDGTLAYGGSNLVQFIVNDLGTISGPAPLTNAPGLAAVGNYGGPTQTIPPSPGSPAIGAGSVAANTFSTDQRGYARTQNGRIDIGAVELPAVSPFAAAPTNGPAPLTVQFQSTNVDNEGSAIIGWNWKFGDGNASALQNPTNVYNVGGLLSPELIVTNSLHLALPVSGPPVFVALLTVTNPADSGPGTLRAAITNSVNGGAINFAPNLSGATIMLASTLAINTSLTIDASALPGGIQINGNAAVTVFHVGPGTTVVLNSLTITNGFSSDLGAGGGIFNYGFLTLNQCTLSGNSAGGSGVGGGICNDGTVTLNQCTLSGNGAQYGGAIVTGNAALTLNQCTLSGNSVSVYGGGIFAPSSGNVRLNECTLSGNSGYYGGGGIYDSGTLTVTNTIVAGNSGGNGADIYLYEGALAYGSSNLVQFVYNQGGTISGPAPLTNAPGLAALGNFGGPTQTMPPLPGSPAIGAGSVAANILSTDQRGYARTQSGLIDLGAVELPIVQPFTANPTKGVLPLTVQFSSTNADSDGSAIVGWTWSFGDGNTSAAQNPTNIYITAGPFSPGLIVTNSLGLTLSVPGPAISASGLLGFASVSLSGTNLTISGSNGISGLPYTVMTSTNLNLPLSQWTPLVTNAWISNGPFSLTLTNVLNPSVPSRFYLLEAPQ
jgi:PKD repeat protein